MYMRAHLTTIEAINAKIPQGVNGQDMMDKTIQFGGLESVGITCKTNTRVFCSRNSVRITFKARIYVYLYVQDMHCLFSIAKNTHVYK